MPVLRRALVVGINNYDNFKTGLGPLNAAARDAADVADRLRTHFDGAPNWIVTELNDRRAEKVLAHEVHTSIENFFGATDDELERLRAQVLAEGEETDELEHELLLYFAGHAVVGKSGRTRLYAYDSHAYGFEDLISDVSSVRAKTITIILDCCMSGNIGQRPGNADPFHVDLALLPTNACILTASRPNEEAGERGLHGLFSEKLLGALDGASTDLMGNVTALSVYSHASESSDVNGQRPMLKTNVVRPAVLREVKPRLDSARLEAITEPRFFPAASSPIHLDQHYEGHPDDPGFLDREKPEEYVAFGGSAKQIELDYLKEWRGAGLVGPADGKTDFYFLCRDGGDVVLTSLGKYYWSLTKGRQDAATTDSQ